MKSHNRLFDVFEYQPGEWRVQSAVTKFVHGKPFVSRAAAEKWGDERYHGGKVEK